MKSQICTYISNMQKQNVVENILFCIEYKTKIYLNKYKMYGFLYKEDHKILLNDIKSE